MSDAEEVGSVGEEAWKLWSALNTSDAGAPHACPVGWCPLCQVVEYVNDHPEAVARVGASAASLLHSLRDLITPPEDPR